MTTIARGDAMMVEAHRLCPIGPTDTKEAAA